MPKLSQAHVGRCLKRAANGSNTTECGEALQDLARYLFGRIPGVEPCEDNVRNAFGTEEIDVPFWNKQLPTGLYFLPNLFPVECKYWDRPVGSKEVAYFGTILRHRGCDCGIILAMKGIAGTVKPLTAAYYEVTMALAQGQRILILDESDIKSVTSTRRLALLLKRQYSNLILYAANRQ
jgi:hypothetical protein